MAGEWFSADACLPQKPETLELIDTTGLDEDSVIGRLWKLWGWACLNCDEQGRAKISLRILAMATRTDEGWLEAVEKVGWLIVDREAKTIEIPGWEHRFSKTAKARQLARIRAEKQRNNAGQQPVDETDDAPDEGGVRRQRTTPCAPSAPNRGDRGDSSSSSAGACAGGPPAGLTAWPEFREVWNAGQGKRWDPRKPPDGMADCLADPEWVEEARKAIARIPQMRYFRTPPTLLQFIRPGFVRKANGGGYDDLTQPKPRAGIDDRPPPRVDPEFEKARAATLQRLKREQEAEHARLDEKARQRNAS